MPIKLTDENLTQEEKAAIIAKINDRDANLIVCHKFIGKTLSATEFQEFQKIVNQRRPYCSKDFIKQTFIPDLSHIR